MRRSTLVIGAGSLIVVAGAVLTLTPWLEAYRWQASPEAAQAQRNAAAPQVVPPRSTPTRIAGPTLAPAVAVARPTALPTVAMARAESTAMPVDVQAPGLALPLPPPMAPPPPLPSPTLAPSDLEMGDVAFQFLDPPQPGSTAVLSVMVHNPTEAPSGVISLDLPLAWLKGYRIEGVVPLPTDGTLNGERLDTSLRLTVDGPPAGGDLEVALYVVTTEEVIDAPDLRLLDAQGRLVGRAQPPTEAPHAAPGPVYAVDIPSLRLHAGVVQVDWEPPLFVIGQVRSSAHVTEGNSVLVGHVRGVAGYNVFDHLDKLSIGDQVIASSRGENYPFVVTQLQVLPQDDTSPTLPTDSPRLTLMTCAGDFNPLTGEYPDRLWVVAEPAEVVAARANATPTLALAPGVLGSTDAEVAGAFGAPVGESPRRLAVYRRGGIEHQAQLLDVPSESGRRAALVVEQTLPLSMDDARRRAKTLLPKDARPRSALPDGNGQFAVEYFTSTALAQSLPPEWFTARRAEPGEFIVVYNRRPDGRVIDLVVGIGNDPSALLGLI